MKGFTHESGASTVSVEWYTPPEIFESLGLTFDLDPCSPPLDLGFVPATKKISLPDDGLSANWHGNVWLNPPYGRQTPAWIDRLIEHKNGIALVFARTDSAWFQRAARNSDGIIFITKRVRFINGLTGKRGDSPGASSCLIVFGESNWEAATQSNLGVAMTSTVFHSQ
jgi:hypothetical protein